MGKNSYWLVENSYTYNNEAPTSGVLKDIADGNAPVSGLSYPLDDQTPLSGVSLANPATLMANRIAAFFKADSDVTTHFAYNGDENKPTLYVFVTDPDKADYINRIIIHKHEFGGIDLNVKVVQACAGDVTVLSEPSDTISLSNFEILEKATKGNANVVKFFSIYVQLFNVTYNFCETAPTICFYQADNISNAHGFEAALPVDLIRDVFNFENMGCFISTYVPKCK